MNQYRVNFHTSSGVYYYVFNLDNFFEDILKTIKGYVDLGFVPAIRSSIRESGYYEKADTAELLFLNVDRIDSFDVQPATRNDVEVCDRCLGKVV